MRLPLKAHIRENMPRWRADGGAPFVPYTVPALELRRMLSEARANEAAPFELVYTRLVGLLGDEAWRQHSTGVAVRLRVQGGQVTDCSARDETLTDWWSHMQRAGGGGWHACASDELSLLPYDWATYAALKFGLYYPLAIVPEAPTEIVCNY